MANQKEMINGVLHEMSDADQAAYDALQAAWPAKQAEKAARAALPDIPTQVANLTAALLSANAISPDALPPEQITAVNATLTSAGQPNIDVKALGIALLAPKTLS